MSVEDVTGARPQAARLGRTPELAALRHLGQRLAPHQLFWIFVSIRLTTTVALLPNLTGSRAGRDAWLGFLTALLPSAALAWRAADPATRLPGRGLVALSREAFGFWAGTVLALSYLGGYLLATAIVLREYTEAIVTAILPSTPPVVAVSVITLLAAVTAAQETPTVGRFAVLVGAILVLSVLAVAGLAAPEVRPERLQPLMSTGWQGLASGTLVAMVWFSQYFFYPPLVPALLDPVASQRALVAAVVVSSLLGAFIAVLVVTVMTAELAVNAAFPLFEVARLVAVGEFVQRIDAIAIGAWGLGLILSSSSFFHAGALGMAELLKLPHHRVVVKPMGVILVVLAFTVARDTVELRRFTDVRVLGPYVAALVWIPTILGAILVRRKARRAPEAAPGPTPAGHPPGRA